MQGSLVLQSLAKNTSLSIVAATWQKL